MAEPQCIMPSQQEQKIDLPYLASPQTNRPHSRQSVPESAHPRAGPTPEYLWLTHKHTDTRPDLPQPFRPPAPHFSPPRFSLCPLPSMTELVLSREGPGQPYSPAVHCTGYYPNSPSELFKMSEKRKEDTVNTVNTIADGAFCSICIYSIDLGM